MMSTGRRALKQQKANDYIEQLIRTLNPGEALPPIRKMMQDSGLGRNVLENAIHGFEGEKFLTVKDRSGIYRTDVGLSLPADTVVDLVACSEIGYMEDPTLFVGDLVMCLLSEGSRLKYSIRIHRVSYYSPVKAYEDLIREQGITHAILLLPHHNDIARVFEEAGVHHMVLFPRYYPSQGYSIVDCLDDVERQMEYLIARGHRRIGLIHTVDQGFYSMADSRRREDYYRVMAEHGFKVEPSWVIHYSYDEHVMEERLSAMMESETLPTALLICDHFAVPVYNFFKSRQLVIGRDMSLISNGGFLRARVSPKLTTSVVSRQHIARRTWSIFQRIGSGKHAPVIESSEPKLVEGESVATLLEP